MLGNKIIAFDSLRVVAILSVIVLHASAGQFVSSYPAFDWFVATFYESFSRWNVSVFFMISGALFLRSSKELNIKRLYSKNILRIVAVFVFWSILYALLIPSVRCNVIYFVLEILSGPYHFWFLKVLIGVYVAIPIYKYIVLNKKIEQYFLLIAFVLGIILPSIYSIVGTFNKTLEEVLENVVNSFDISVVSTYSFFFVLGHYLVEYPIKKGYRHVIYYLGLIAPILVMIATYYISNHNATITERFFGNSFICTVIEAVAVFVLFITRFNSQGRFDAFFAKASKNVMGIYIVHVMVMILLSEFGIEPNTFNSLFFIPVYSLVVFVISYVFVELLQRIPYVNKWLI